MKITDYLTKDCIKVYLKGDNKTDIISELVDLLAKKHPQIDKKTALENLIKREQLETTAVGNGVAIPHASLENITDIYPAVGLIKDTLDYNALDKQPVKLVFLMLYPKDKIGLEIRFLARVSRLLHVTNLKQELFKCTDANEFFDKLKIYETKHFG